MDMEALPPVKKQPVTPPTAMVHSKLESHQLSETLQASPLASAAGATGANAAVAFATVDSLDFSAYRLFADSPTQPLQSQQQMFPDYQLQHLQQHQPEQQQQLLQLQHPQSHHHPQQQQQQHLASLYDLPRPEKVPVSTISYLPQHHQFQQSHLQPLMTQIPTSSSNIVYQPMGSTLNHVDHLASSAVTMGTTSRYPIHLIDGSDVAVGGGGGASATTTSSCSPTSSTSASNQTPPSGPGRRGNAGSARKKPVPNDLKDTRYFERRKRNNAAAKKSRDARKQREDEVAVRASFLEKENAMLRSQLNSLREEVNSLRETLRMQQQQQQQQQQNSHRDLPVS